MKICSLLLLQIGGATFTPWATINFDDGARIGTGNRGKFPDSNDLLYRDASGNKGNLNGLIFDTRAGGESAGMFFNGNGMTLWNPADNQALHFVDSDEPDTSKWWITGSGDKFLQSDERRKRDIRPYEPKDFIEKFEKINVVTYNRKQKMGSKSNGPSREMGLIAQEAQKLGILDQLIDDVTVEPDFIDDGVSTRYFIDYERLNVVLLKAVQEMTTELHRKQEMVEELEKNNITLEGLLNS